MTQSKTNFLSGSTNPIDENNALNEICNYLVSLGKFNSVDEAKREAVERVNFFSESKLYDDDPSMNGASIERKSVHALIYGYELHDIIEKNKGYLPVPNKKPSSSKGGAESFKELFSLVQQEIKLGYSRDKIVEKLMECGAEERLARGIYYAVKSCYKKKIIARVIVFVVVVIAVIFVINV